jgi:non-reducing end alpha-L-arabinofuranosidase
MRYLSMFTTCFLGGLGLVACTTPTDVATKNNVDATGGSGQTATGGAVNVGGSATGGTTVATGGTTQAAGGTTSSTTVSPTGGKATGGNGSGGVATGGTSTSSTSTSSTAAGGNPTGGSPTGGTTQTIGGTTSNPGGRSGGGATSAAGGKAGSGAGGTPTGGSGGGGNTGNVTGPCDIYAAASPATPCVAAYSPVRLLNSKYTGPLYQVRKGGSSLGTGGTTTDIGTIEGGFADGAAHEAACGSSGCTFSILYDQSGKGNNVKVAPAGCYEGTASEPDYESSATKRSLSISGHKVYALYMVAHDGYRNNSGVGIPKGSEAQGIYEVADGKRIGAACCFDFGNASTNNCNQGTMNALFFGTGYWGKGAGSGPWFMADLEGGVWSGGTGASNATNSNLPSSNMDFAFGILKTSSSNYCIRVGNGQTGNLTTAYDGGLPKTLSHPGGIILGIGGDNSNSSQGTFFEGAITAGRPSDATDALVLANVQAAKYTL